MNIPVAILIFENNGVISYRAYSPSEYHYHPDGTTPDHRSEQFSQFIERVNNTVLYNPLDSNNNITTRHGQLKEVYSDHILVPLNQRGDICYFYTYANEHCSYRPIHRASPIFFDEIQANNHICLDDIHRHTCTHAFV
jgi:hypothetical protein